MHTAVNPLAGEEHLKEVIQQLQLMGEVGGDGDGDGDGKIIQYLQRVFLLKKFLLLTIFPLTRLSISSVTLVTI